MTHTTKLSDGTTAHVNVHGRPKGARKVQLPGGMYYVKGNDGTIWVYAASGEFETALRDKEQAVRYAERKAEGK